LTRKAALASLVLVAALSRQTLFSTTTTTATERLATVVVSTSDHKDGGLVVDSIDNVDNLHNGILSRPQSFPRVAPGGTLYTCGWPNTKLAQTLFPEYIVPSSTEQSGSVRKIVTYRPGGNTDYQPNDILLWGMNGPCAGVGKNFTQQVAHAPQFPGVVLFSNCEPYGSIFFDNDNDAPARAYQIGGLPDKANRVGLRHALRVFFLAIVLNNKYDASQQAEIFDPTQRPLWNGDRRALLYTAKNCVAAREARVDAVVAALHATDSPAKVEYAGRCHGNTNLIKAIPTTLIERYPTISRKNLWDNWKLYRHYQFCLVFENSKSEGYISEKLLLAFLGGCLPIYWGSEEVLEVFDRRSFVYWDDANPHAALAEIQHLAANDTAYWERMQAPILKDGNSTIRQFFSLSDSVGGGYLKRLIRDMMGLASSR
jgi:hypothetical protein